jgi:hypothetical protein
MVRDIDGAGTPPSEACTFAKLFVATLLVRRRTWQRIQTRNHLGDGGRGRVKGHHISGPNDNEFDALPEGGVLGQPDGFRVAAPDVRDLAMVMASRRLFSSSLPTERGLTKGRSFDCDDNTHTPFKASVPHRSNWVYRRSCLTLLSTGERNQFLQLLLLDAICRTGGHWNACDHHVAVGRPAHRDCFAVSYFLMSR